MRSLIERYWHVDRSMKGKKGVVTLNIVIGSLPKPPSAECLKMNLTMKPQI